MSWEVITGDCLDTLRTLDDCSIDAVVTDPPYGLGKEPDALAMLTDWIGTGHHEVKGSGFMGKAWDSFVPQPVLWAECLRVLKPGGHLLAFGGTRTFDLVLLGLRIAGFEIRDEIAVWTYGSGFPKSLNVSKAIDSIRDDREEILKVTKWIADARDAAGITNRDIDDAFGFAGMSGHWTSQRSQPAVPTLEQVPRLLSVLDADPPEEIRRLILDLNGRKGERGEAFFLREVIGVNCGAMSGWSMDGSTRFEDRDITAPATEAAKQWDGWGTALKPAHEPIAVVRKPLEGTVAGNVLKWGTGGINVEASRVHTAGRVVLPEPSNEYEAAANKIIESVEAAGRWPPNLLLVHHPDCATECVPECHVRVMGEQSGEGTSGAHKESVRANTGGYSGPMPPVSVYENSGDTGTAARFFPQFRYCAKPSKAEKVAGVTPRKVSGGEATDRKDGSAGLNNPRAGAGRTGSDAPMHPTTKPISLMRWLCRLVCPPDGVILDPFAGSGTTGAAARLEGFRFLGCEMDPDYAEIARERIAFWEQVDPDYDHVPTPDVEDERQSSLF